MLSFAQRPAGVSVETEDPSISGNAGISCIPPCCCANTARPTGQGKMRACLPVRPLLAVDWELRFMQRQRGEVCPFFSYSLPLTFSVGNKKLTCWDLDCLNCFIYDNTQEDCSLLFLPVWCLDIWPRLTVLSPNLCHHLVNEKRLEMKLWLGFFTACWLQRVTSQPRKSVRKIYANSSTFQTSKVVFFSIFSSSWIT